MPPCSCWWTSPFETAGSSAKPLSAHPVPSGKSGSGKGKAGDSKGIYYRKKDEFKTFMSQKVSKLNKKNICV